MLLSFLNGTVGGGGCGRVALEGKVDGEKGKGKHKGRFVGK